MKDGRQRSKDFGVCRLLAVAALLCMVASDSLLAQLSERVNDPLGLSLRVGRVQVIHSDERGRAGTSMDLQQTDPWLAYQLGQSYFQREWTTRDGLFKSLQPRPLAGTANACAMCHNLPFRSPGAGGNIGGDFGGFGRNTPHLFGIGLIEMLGMQVRQQIMANFDTNKNGFLDDPAETKGRRAIITAAPNVTVDFGSLEDLDGDGQPELNDVIKVMPVDREGRSRPLRADKSLSHLGDPEIAGYDISVAVISSSVAGDQEPTIRMFAEGVLHLIMGIDVADSTITNNSGKGRDRRADDGWAETSNAGALQPYIPQASLPSGNPFQHVSEGEIDLLEWFLLNSPAPALGRQDANTKRGRLLLGQFGCTSCHVSDWVIQASDEERGFTGDRRFFDLQVAYDPALGKLAGRLQPLAHADATSNLVARRRQSFPVRGVFTDLLHHDVGSRFYDYGSQQGRLYVNKRYRTTPLWGVGSTAPYGHDGRSPTLDDVIRRHGGEAKESAALYETASLRDRNALISFLESLVLYQPDTLPTDINGDGKIAVHFTVQGIDVGPERFFPELLFRVPPRYRGWVTNSGDSYFSYELLNANEVYGRSLDALRDLNHNGIPDVAESKP